jgi:hypothetical protein
MTHAPVDLAQCPNCGRDLDGAFCAECGQKVTSINPTLHDFLHDLVHEFLHVDGKIFRSVRLLLTRPGFLTQEHFQGRRARYISPIRLYLIFSVAFFALDHVAPRSRNPVQITMTSESQEDLAKLKELGFENEEELEQAASAVLVTYMPRLMFVLVPVFALLVKLVTRRSGRNYPQHVYFALHLHAAGFAFLTLAALTRFAGPAGVFSRSARLALSIALLIYVVMAFRRAYGGTATRAVARVAVVGVLYLVVTLFALLAVVLPVFAPRLSALIS